MKYPRHVYLHKRFLKNFAENCLFLFSYAHSTVMFLYFFLNLHSPSSKLLKTFYALFFLLNISNLADYWNSERLPHSNLKSIKNVKAWTFIWVIIGSLKNESEYIFTSISWTFSSELWYFFFVFRSVSKI